MNFTEELKKEGTMKIKREREWEREWERENIDIKRKGTNERGKFILEKYTLIAMFEV